jgi:hypothetical protein
VYVVAGVYVLVGDGLSAKPLGFDKTNSPSQKFYYDYYYDFLSSPFVCLKG